MKVRDIMTREVHSCRPDTDLAEAAMIMWRHDCGLVPVVDEHSRVVGVITDRDICMALCTRPFRPEQIRVEDVMTGKSFAVQPEDSVRLALQTLRNKRVRRLPVVDDERKLQGILSINDVLLQVRSFEDRPGEPLMTDVLATLQGICAHGDSERRHSRRERLVPAAL